MREPYCQLSVINYSKEINGKQALIFSNPNSSSRANGTVRIGLISQNGTHENGEPKYEFDWKYNKLVKPGYFAYSCLTELSNGNVGLFYEGTDVKEMSYNEMNIDYLKFNIDENITFAQLENINIIDKKESYSKGDEFKVELEFNQSVSLMGDRSINIKIGNELFKLSMVNYNGGNKVIFKGTIPNDIEDGNYELIISPNKNLEIINVFDKTTLIDKDINTGIEISVR